jgi:hypothetical protein
MINVTNECSVAQKKVSQRGNHGWDHWETHGEAVRHGWQESTRHTQEISICHK